MIAASDGSHRRKFLLLNDIRHDGLPYPSGMCRAPRWLMKTATEVPFGKSDNSRNRFLSGPLGSRRPVAAIRHAELNPVRSYLVREVESRDWGKVDSAERVADERRGCGSSGSARGDRQVHGCFASRAATLPPRSPGCDNPGALGPAGLAIGRRRGLGQGPLDEPDGRLEAVRREAGTEGKRHRCPWTETALRAHLLWAVSGLRQNRSPGSRALVAACGIGTDSV